MSKFYSIIKYLFSSALFFFLSAAAVFAAGTAPATDEYGLNTTADVAKIPMGGTIATKIGTITGYLLSLIGVLFFGLMLYGGFLWMTAKGDEAQAKKAQGIIVDAVIGLVIVAASYIITKFVFGAVTVK